MKVLSPRSRNERFGKLSNIDEPLAQLLKSRGDRRKVIDMRSKFVRGDRKSCMILDALELFR